MSILLKPVLIGVEELEKYAYRDSLTNLLTRKTMNGYLEIAYKMAQSYGKPFCLLLLDIDDFKVVNDTYGHECGEKVAVTVTIGVIAYDPKYDVEKLMEKVDKRFYEGKRSGKNQVVSR